MKSVKQQTASKIGLFSAIMIIFGTLVGIGVFFKNYSVFKNNNGNSLGILLSWIITIIMVMCMALSFCEICTCKIKNKADGFGGWAERFTGHGFGRFTKLGYSLIFYAVNTFAIMFFTGEGCMNCFANLGSGSPGEFDFGNLTTLYVFLIGGGLFALFVILNVIASKAMSKFSNITGIIKFIPIAAVIILGIVFGILNRGGGLFNNNWYDPDNPAISQPIGNIDITGIIVSIPAILFAFEGYLVVGNIANDMENPEKNVPLSVILGLIIISSLYLVITIGCMVAGTGNVYQLMEICFGKGTELSAIFTNIFSVFIFICILGVLNAITFGGMRAFQANCEDGTLFKGKSLVAAKPNNKLFAGGIWLAAMVGVWWLALLIPSSILNTDQMVDGSSNIMIVALYVMYGVVLVCAFANRFTKKVEVRKMKIFPVTCAIGIIACVFMIGFIAFYQFLARPIIESADNGWNTEYACGWGLFVKTNFKLNYWQAMVAFWSMFVFMILSPLLNDLFIKWWDKKNKQVLIWEKPEKLIRFS